MKSVLPNPRDSRTTHFKKVSSNKFRITFYAALVIILFFNYPVLIRLISGQTTFSQITANYYLFFESRGLYVIDALFVYLPTTRTEFINNFNISSNYNGLIKNSFVLILILIGIIIYWFVISTIFETVERIVSKSFRYIKRLLGPSTKKDYLDKDIQQGRKGLDYYTNPRDPIWTSYSPSKERKKNGILGRVLIFFLNIISAVLTFLVGIMSIGMKGNLPESLFVMWLIISFIYLLNLVALVRNNFSKVLFIFNIATLISLSLLYLYILKQRYDISPENLNILGPWFWIFNFPSFINCLYIYASRKRNLE